MGYTHKGTKWEYQQSWYLLALFTPWFYWFPLVFTGIRTLQIGWILVGLFYGLPVFLHTMFNPADFGISVFFRNWEWTALVVAAIHSLRARGEYLVRLANSMETREMLMEGARLRREMAAQAQAGAGEAAVDDAPPRAAPLEAASADIGPAPSKPMRRLFDVNLIGERELAMLPGMGPARARQAMALRESLGGFHSFDHFAEKLGLTGDACERLRGIFVQPEAAAQTSTDYMVGLDGRRILEINLASAAAIATLPGLDFEVARRAVALRDADGPFQSLEDFRYRLGLPTDLMIPLSPLVSTLRTPAKPQAGLKTGGRIVDANDSGRSDPAAAVKPSGRIVDL